MLQDEYPELESSIKWLHVNDQYIWLSGTKALWRIDIMKKNIVPFNQYIGIPHHDIQAITSHEGIVYLGTKKGLIYFDESIDPMNAVAPSMALEQIIAESAGAISTSGNLNLPYYKNALQIQLSSISLRSKGAYYYAYRLVELDSNWTFLEAGYGTLNFPTLPSGNHTLEVRAINESGISSKTVTLYISVDYPVWERWWFYILVTLVGLSIMAFLFKLRVNFIRKKADQKTRLIQSQLTALKAQMNPHFMYNALNSIQALIFQNDIKNSTLYLGKFSHLMRKILEASGKELISLQEEIEILKLYLELEKLRFKQDFTYELIVEDEIDAHSISLPPMLIQPYIENAFKHGLLHKKGDKKLKIRFFEKNHDTICEITDNGIGRKHAEEIKARLQEKHQSFATQANEKRVELLNDNTQRNYNVWIEDLMENNEPSGTRVQIIIDSKK